MRQEGTDAAQDGGSDYGGTNAKFVGASEDGERIKEREDRSLDSIGRRWGLIWCCKRTARSRSGNANAIENRYSRDQLPVVNGQRRYSIYRAIQV